MFANPCYSIRPLFISLFVFCLLATLNAHAQVTQTLGSLEVDRLGAAVYHLPISVPNGIGGVKPNISALYNSQAANGLLGKGGSIGGLSVIKRCNQTLVRDGINKAITWTVDDRFCIDTQRLMLITGTQGAADSQYKTEIDNGVVYTAKGGAVGNPDYFEARAEDGAILVFGGVATAKEQGAATMTWALSQYKDVANNAIEYVYEGTAADGLRIKRINYAFAVPNTTNDPGAYIEFIYRDRDDPISKYVAGYEFRTNKLLTHINSYSLLGLLHRSYQFDLATSSGLAGYVTRWQSVKECTSLAECFESTQFEWGRTQKNVTTNQIETKNIKVDLLGWMASESNYQLNAQISHCCAVQAADLNGNGIAELAWITRNGSGIYSYATINDFASLPSDAIRLSVGVAATRYDYTSEMLPLEFTDINADGIQDVITPLQGSGGYSDITHPWGINFSRRNSSEWYLGRDYGQFGIYNFVKPLDLDGDGYEEMLGFNQRSIDFTLHKTQRHPVEPVSSFLYRYLNYYTSSSTRMLRLSDIPTASGIFVEYGRDMTAVGDLNNDGKKDLVLLVKLGYPVTDEQIYKINWYEQQNGLLTFKGTIYQESKKPLSTQPYNGGYKLSDFVTFTNIKAVDINGDGLDDVAFQKNGVWMYAINKGDGFSAFTTIPNKPVSKPAISSTFIDVNNDGKADYIYGESTVGYGANPYWDYTNPSVYVRYWNSKTGTFDDPVLIRTSPNYPILFADMNGDGFVDIVENQRNEPDRTKDRINVYGFTNSAGNATVGFQGVLDQDTIVSVKTGININASIDYQTLVRPKQIDILSCVGNIPCFDFSANSNYKPLKIEVTRIGNNNLSGIPAPVASGASEYYTKTNEPFAGLNNPHSGEARVSQYVAPLPIVTRVKNNLNANNDKKYYYEVMRTQSGGRGLLGFEKTAVEDVATGIRTETFWRQDWPFTGLPTSKIIWNKFNKAMSEVEHDLIVSQIDQSKAFKVNVSKLVEKHYGTGINDTVQGGLIGFNSSSSSSQSSSSVSVEYANEPAILELLTPGERSIKYVAAGVNVGLKAVVLSKDGSLWKDLDGNAPVVKFYADDYTYLGESRADGTPFNWMPLASNTYSIKAKVFLEAGAILQSRTAALVVSAAEGYPTVNFLDTIRNGVKYSSGNLVHLVANATDKDGSIINVKFYANNQLVGTASSIGGNNYRFDWTPSSADVYKIKAVTTDNAGNKAESKTLEILYAMSSSSSSSGVSSTSAALLSLPLTYPLTNSVLGDNLQLGSSLKNSSGQQLYGPDGSVPVVRFYANGIYVGESRADGYWFQWKPAAAGVFDVVAVSMLGGEQVVSQTATLIVKGSATANIELTAPKYYGARYEVNNYVGISANVNDSSFKISKVIFYANDQELSTDTTIPYSHAWMPLNSGIYTIKAVAVDVNGNAFISAHKVIHYGVDEFTVSSSSAYSIPSSSQSSSLSSVRDPIKFELTSPLERTTDQYGLGAEVVLGAPVIGANGGTWTDAAGNSAQVNYYANEQLLTGLRKDPRGYYSFWRPTATGTYSIKAVARINENKTITTGYGTVHVINVNAPNVSLVYPASNRFLKLGDSLNLIANASDADGNLSGVNFYANGERLSLPISGNGPFNMLWTPYLTGEYLINADAIDATYVRATTGTVRVSVVNPGSKPAVTLLSPDNGSSLPFGSSLTLLANAIDFDGSISKVEFYANDQLIGTSTAPPYKINYTPEFADTYSFKAVAYDNLDNSTVSSVSKMQYGLSAPSFNIIDPDDDCFYGFNFHQQTDGTNDLVYELYERAQGAEWSATPVARRSIPLGHLPPFHVYFNDHEPGNFEYRARVCPGNSMNACSPYSAIFPVFLYQNCKSIPLPSVQLTAPPTKLKLGESVVLNADARIANNTGLIIRFYYGEKLLGVDSSAPYSVSWTPAETGRNYLYAQAEASHEATGISDMHIVDVLTPEDYVNGAASSTSRSSSSTSSVSVVSRSSSSANNSSQSSLVPQIALFTPEPGKINKTYLGEEAMLFAAVYDQDLRPWKNQDGLSPRIEYYVNNQPITDLRNDLASGIKYWKPTALGNYGIKAIAYLDGQTLTTGISVISVVKPLPPSVNLGIAQGMTLYAGSLFNLVATTVDPDMQTKEVKFFANGEQISLPDFAEPYTAGWIPTLPGSYQLEAELLDKSGNIIRSPVTTLTVEPAILPDFDGVRGVSDFGDAQLQGLKWTPLNHSDLLVSKIPNAGKISYNKLTKFNVNRPLKIINRTDAYTNALWVAKLIVIDAQEIVLNSSIEIIGEPADILLLNSSASKTIQCSACGFKNVGRVTFAVATPSTQLTNAITSIGTLATQVGGVVSVDNLQASGAVSIELLAEKINSNGIINTQQYTTDASGKSIGDVIIPGISKVVGSGGVSLLHGRLDVVYETMKVQEIRTGAPALEFGASITSGAISIISAAPVSVNASLNTASELRAVTQYQGKLHAQAEAMSIKTLAADAASQNSITLNAALITDGKAELTSQGDIHLVSQQASISGHALVLNAIGNFKNHGGLIAKRKLWLTALSNSEPSIQVGANLIENRGSVELYEQSEQAGNQWGSRTVSGNLSLISKTHVLNRFGGFLRAKSIKVVAQEGRIRNGSLYAFDDPLKENEPIATTGHGTQAISTLSILPVSDTKPYINSKAIIQGMVIQLEANTSVENINPYTEPAKPGSAEEVDVRVSRTAQAHADDVRIEAVNKLTITAPQQVLNSSANLGVSEFSLTPALIIQSPLIRNERYYSYTVLDTVDETKQVMEQNPGSTSTTTSSIKGVKARYGFYSPPGTIYSFAPVHIQFGTDATNTNAGLLNNAGFVDIYSTMNLYGIGRVTSLGVKLDKLAYETTSNTRTVLEECISRSYWNGYAEIPYKVCEQGSYDKIKTPEGKYLEPILDNTLFAVAGRLDAKGILFSASNHEVLKDIREQVINNYITAQKGRKYYQFDANYCEEKIDVKLAQDGLSVVTSVSYITKVSANVCPQQGYGETKAVSELVAAKVSSLPYELNSMISRYDSWKSRAAQ